MVSSTRVNCLTSAAYQHCWIDGSAVELPVGKLVCVGRNYADHAAELNNPIPAEPVLFMKPASALCPLAEPITWPQGFGRCHFETELALLIGESRGGAAGVVGLGLALDLTLRELQEQLKAARLPWEKAKAFDRACPLSPLLPIGPEHDLAAQHFELYCNGELRQRGDSAQMLTPVSALLDYIGQFFTLQPGDIVLTGTPAGVGPLTAGDQLELRWTPAPHQHHRFTSRVR